MEDHFLLPKVSSVLNRDVKQFGKKFMFDGDEETCWNSDQGSPQWILVEFSEEVCPQEIQLQFQGGFVGKDCRLEVSSGGGELARFMDFYPEDIYSEGGTISQEVTDSISQ
ncbi:Nuclear receptor 2C2-associated protein [Branchiostoma belcheri]|nr:Nuclear receptor 2C2-associated protein [Branchiostoma belcheri]